jgi:hypothetical protein
MFGAQVKLLASTLKQQALSFENQLVALYAANLSTVGTQAALVATFAFSARNNVFYWLKITSTIYAYIYHICFTISTIASLMSLSNAVVSSMFAPKFSLLGTDADSMYQATEMMKKQERFTLRCGFVAVLLLFIGSVFIAIENCSIILSVILTSAFVFGYIILYYDTSEIYSFFFKDREKGTFSSRYFTLLYSCNGCTC